MELSVSSYKKYLTSLSLALITIEMHHNPRDE